MPTVDWNDLRAFAAVMRHGSTAKAAKALGVEQTTCARRIAALEEAWGLTLFTRTPRGYEPTESAQRLGGRAKALAAAVEELARAAEAEQRQHMGRIRVTTEEILAPAVVIPALARFQDLCPDVDVSLDVTSEVRDLIGGEADIAVRSGPGPQEPALVRRKLGEQRWGVYCAKAYAARREPPASIPEMVGHSVASLDGLLEATRAYGIDPRQLVSTFTALRSLVEGGSCVAAMPCTLAEASPHLQLCFELETPNSHAWLVYPERVRDAPAVKTLAKLFVEAYRAANRPQA